MDTQIHGSTCVKRYFLSPLEDIHAYFNLSVIELQFWVNEGSPTHQIQIEEDKKLAALAVYSHHTL